MPTQPKSPLSAIGKHLDRRATPQPTASELRLDPRTGELVLAPPDAPQSDGVVVEQIAQDGFFAPPRVVVAAGALEGIDAGTRRDLLARGTDGLGVLHVEPAAHASGSPSGAAPPGSSRDASRPGWTALPCAAVAVPAPEFERARALAESVALEQARGAAALALLVAPPEHGGQSPQVAAVLARDGKAFRCEVTLGPSRDELFSRSRGLLETDALAARKVAIVGLGSGGAPIALDLARAGVGSFVLVDPDTLELANVARHPCGMRDLGRLKVDAMRDALQDRNPYASIETHALDVNADLARTRALLAGCDLVVGATDGTRSRANLNRLALELGLPALFGRAITRAAGGDVLRVRPHAGPCLACVFGMGGFAGDAEEISGRRQVDRDAPAYVPEGARVAQIQPGLATDIAPIANMMTRLALVELSRGTSGAVTSLESDLEADLYLWANRRERTYAGWEPMGFRTGGLAVLRWYGVRATRNERCLECGTPASSVETPAGPLVFESSPPVWA